MDIREFRIRARKFIEESEAVIGHREPWWYSAKVSEEAGEVAKAFNRQTGLGRKFGSRAELAEEICQEVMACFILAEAMDMDLSQAFDADYQDIMTRGFRAESDPEPWT
jgi:NTP pyrophosphatase (non-canonical NTP hydrolase)